MGQAVARNVVIFKYGRWVHMLLWPMPKSGVNVLILDKNFIKTEAFLRFFYIEMKGPFLAFVIDQHT